MLISVIIPTCNDEATIAATLVQLSTQPGDFEVIVVDGGSTDNTLSFVKGRVKILPLLDTRGGSLLTFGASFCFNFFAKTAFLPKKFADFYV